MTGFRFIKAWLIGAAIAAVVPSQPLLATGDEEGPIKDIACNAVGCSHGKQKCAESHGELSDPLIGKISVTWFCYEPDGADGGLEGGSGFSEG